MDFLDLSGVKEQKSFALVPAGEYRVMVEKAELKDTKDGTGAYINVKYKITDGEEEGRFLFGMFNIRNKNQQATEIGLSQLKSFMACAGCTDFKLKSVVDLEGLTAVAVVKHKTDSYGEKAVVSYFKPYGTDLKAGSGKPPVDNLPF